MKYAIPIVPTRQRQGEGDSVKSPAVVLTAYEAEMPASFCPEDDSHLRRYTPSPYRPLYI